MKNKIVFIDGPFDGHVGAAYMGVTEFWKKADNREYRYSRASERTFRYDRRWRKTKGSKHEQERLPQLREQSGDGSGHADRRAESQSEDH